jgi:hypothetical protein
MRIAERRGGGSDLEAHINAFSGALVVVILQCTGAYARRARFEPYGDTT